MPSRIAIVTVTDGTLVTSHVAPCQHSGSLRVHRRLVHGGPAYECEGCLATYRGDDLLQSSATCHEYTLTSDSGSETVLAPDADDAARQLARTLRIRAETSALLRYEIDRTGGYGTLSGPDGIIWSVRS